MRKKRIRIELIKKKKNYNAIIYCLIWENIFLGHDKAIGEMPFILNTHTCIYRYVERTHLIFVKVSLYYHSIITFTQKSLLHLRRAWSPVYVRVFAVQYPCAVIRGQVFSSLWAYTSIFSNQECSNINSFCFSTFEIWILQSAGFRHFVESSSMLSILTIFNRA